MKFKRIVALMLAAALMLSAAACGGTPASSGASESSKPEASDAVTDTTKPTTVRVMTFMANDDTTRAVLQGQKALFEEMNPGVTLELIEADVTIEGGKLTTMLNSGVDIPDVINVNAGPSRIGMLADAGSIQPLDELYVKNGWADKINPAAMPLRTTVDGKIYEVPNSMDAISCYYNKDIFEKLSIEIPTTFDDFLKACEAIKAAGIEPVSLGARDGYAVGWLFGNMLQSAAGTEKAISLVNGEAAWTDPEAVQGITLFDDMIKKGYISDVSSTRGEVDALYSFLDGKAAMYFVGTWVLSTINDNNKQDNIGTFVLPSQKGDAQSYPTSGLGNSWVIPTDVKDTAGAELWMEFVLSEELAKFFADNPDNNSIYTSKAFAKAEVASPLLKIAKESISQNAGANPSVFIGAEAKNAYYQNLQGLVAGLVTPTEVAANIQAAHEKDVAAQ